MSANLKAEGEKAAQAPQAVKMEKQKNSDFSDRDTKHLCAMIREEGAEELAKAGMGNNAARKRRAMAVLS